MSRKVGYALLFTTNATREEIERALDAALREVGEQGSIDMIIELDEESVRKEYGQAWNDK